MNTGGIWNDVTLFTEIKIYFSGIKIFTELDDDLSE